MGIFFFFPSFDRFEFANLSGGKGENIDKKTERDTAMCLYFVDKYVCVSVCVSDFHVFACFNDVQPCAHQSSY